MRVPWAIWFILVGFVFMTLAYSSNTPYRQGGHLLFSRDPETGGPQKVVDVGAPDERQHANYISYLLEGRGFPVLVPGDPNLGEMYQAHQPPLFYLIGAGWSTVVGADPASPDAGIKLRFLNTLIGLATLLGVFWLVKWGLGREDAALAAMAFAAFLPMNVALHAAVSNDPLLYCLVTWCVALVVKGVQQGWVMRDAILIGILGGLAILTKTTALALVPTLFVAMLISWRSHDPEPRPRPLMWASVLILPILVAAPWLWRNIGVYGDPFALKVFNEAFVGSPQASVFIESFGFFNYLTQWVGWFTARSFIGVFGYMDVYFFEALRSENSGRIYLALMLFIFSPILWGLVAFKTHRTAAEDDSLPEPWRLQAVLGVLAFVVILLFVRFNLTYFQGQARYLFPALGAFSAWFGLGLTGMMRGRGWAPYAWIVASVFLIGLDLIGLMTITSGFPIRLNQ